MYVFQYVPYTNYFAKLSDAVVGSLHGLQNDFVDAYLHFG